MEKNLTKKLAVFLIKNNFKTFDSTLKSKKDIFKYTLNDNIKDEGLIVIGQQKDKEPDWKNLLQTISQGKIQQLNNSSNRAVLFFRKNKRIFAICFGYGKYLLNEDSIERDFGLKTALNIIDADKLISIDKANIGDLNLLTKTQASKKGSPYHFEIDILRDLIKGVTGEPKVINDGLYGNIITGNESLHIAPKVRLSEVPKILMNLHSSYISDTYKERFDWIDNIKPEKDPNIINKLKNELLSALNNNKENIHLSPPFFIDWENFEYMSYTPKGDQFNEFDIKDFITYKFEDNFEFETWEQLLKQNLYFKLSNHDFPFSSKFWRFLNFEIELDGFRYVFTSSNWYKISKSYYSDIYKYCSQIEESSSKFIDCKKSDRGDTKGKYDEGIFNEDLAKSSIDYLLFDKNFIKSEISMSSIEFCDIFNKSNNEIIHVKFGGRSSTLSHLFSQGRVSANSLQKDREFRKNLRTKLKYNKNLIPIENKNFNTSDFTITYAIIDDKNRSFVDSLPFFSLVNFRLTLDDLLNRGYKLKVKKILKI